MIPLNCEHPAYGRGSLISFNAETQIGHFIFYFPPGMARSGDGVLPYADMRLDGGRWTVDGGPGTDECFPTAAAQ